MTHWGWGFSLPFTHSVANRQLTLRNKAQSPALLTTLCPFREKWWRMLWVLLMQMGNGSYMWNKYINISSQQTSARGVYVLYGIQILFSGRLGRASAGMWRSQGKEWDSNSVHMEREWERQSQGRVLAIAFWVLSLTHRLQCWKNEPLREGCWAVLYTFHCIVLKCLRSGALLHGHEIQCCCCAGPRSLGVRPYLKSWKATESLFLLHLHFSDVQHAWLKLLFYFFCGVCEEITWRLRSRAELDWPQVPQLI